MQNTSRPQIDPKQLRKTILIWGAVVVVALVVWRVGFGVIWREGLIRPSLNALLFLYTYLGRNFVVAITVFTLILRLITMPLQFQQIKAAKKMAELQPRMSELQKKYGGDKNRMAQEQQKLYKDAGANPLSGCLPTLIQFPIWIALYQGINAMLADTPLKLMNLGKDMYAGFAPFISIIPLQSRFLWLDLAKPDPTPFVLPVLVGGTMWLQQKLMTPTSGSDQQQQSMNQTMQVMMPLMFGYFTTQFASGLAIYFVVSNIIGIITQWGIERIQKKPAAVVHATGSATATLPADSAATQEKESASYGRKKQRRKAKR